MVMQWCGRIVLDVYRLPEGEGITVVANMMPHGECPEGIMREECSTSTGTVEVVEKLLSRLVGEGKE